MPEDDDEPAAAPAAPSVAPAEEVRCHATCPPRAPASTHTRPHPPTKRPTGAQASRTSGPLTPPALQADDEGEDLYDDNLNRDYVADPVLDAYERGSDDERAFSPATREQQRRAERNMRKRDNDEATRAGRIPRALESSSDDEERPRQRRRRAEIGDSAAETPDEDDDDDLDEMNVEGPPKQYFGNDRVQNKIIRAFKRFLKFFSTPAGTAKYAEKITHMCAQNEQSLIVRYMDLEGMLGFWVADYPSFVLPLFNEAAWEVVEEMFPNYRGVHQQVYVRISELPVQESIRDIRQSHMNCLIRVDGVVTRRTGVFPKLASVKYSCNVCGYTTASFTQNDSNDDSRPDTCPECQTKNQWTVNQEQTVYQNYQKITLQESPGSVPAGRLPRYKDVILLEDLIDLARPGDEIEVTGVYTYSYDFNVNKKNGFPVFSTEIMANHIAKKEDAFAAFSITDDDRREIRKLSKEPRIADRIFASMAPSIYGHVHIKRAVALTLFGGQPKEVAKNKMRGDINVLLLGDPGTAKSQFLKYIEKTAHRAVFTTGKGASAAGLTATVHKDPVTRQWTLEGGALVLADKGHCLIDEFDKMNDQDRTSIHEAMEQQSISISKAGIVTSLQARCSVVAAANPISGRYNAQVDFAHNVELTEPILSRFDILCVVRDTVDPASDERLAKFVVESHIASHPNTRAAEAAEIEGVQSLNGGLEEEPVSTIFGVRPLKQSMLKKYIMCSKQCKPKLQHMDQDKISKLYTKLRKESSRGGGMPIALRHLESIIRMSEAHARMHLREYVNEADVDLAISMMLESFFQSQKQTVRGPLETKFRAYLQYGSDTTELLVHLLDRILKDEIEFRRLSNSISDHAIEIDAPEFERRAREYSVAEFESFYGSDAFRDNSSYDEERRLINYVPIAA
jgi:DNA replication licensing factor MCM2